jgi:regulator of protease activity HflC (stomatin/prohibitin superfamily)
MRIRTLDVMKQQIMTKDNVPVHVNAAIFFKVENPEHAIIQVQDYAYAITQYAQTALRDVIGGKTLDTLFVERQEIGDAIKKLVDNETERLGPRRAGDQDSGYRSTRRSQAHHEPAGGSRTREACEHHQERRRQRSREKSGRRRKA